MSSSINPDSGVRTYPNLMAIQKRLLPEKTAALTAIFNRTASIAEGLREISSEQLTQDQRKVKWFDERLKTIDQIFKGSHGGAQPTDDDKKELLYKLSLDECEPSRVSICETFIATVGDVKADHVVSHLIREMKRVIIQEVITTNPIVKQKFIHTINAMNLFIKERAEDLGIAKDDPLYQEALKDIYTGGVRGAISDSMAGDATSFFDALVEKFSSTYTQQALVSFASDWINKPERDTLRKELAPLLMKKLEPSHEDPSDYVVKHCLKDLKDYEFTEKGIASLFADEIKGMSETFAYVKKQVEENGLVLESLSDKWRADPRIVRAAVLQNGQALQYAERNVQLLLIKENPTLLQFASHDLQNHLYINRELQLAIIKDHPAIIAVLPEHIKSDKAFILAAMEQNRDAICYVPEALSIDHEFMHSLINIFGFGEKKWEKYFGDVGEVPPLPADIGKILRSDCPYFKDKKIGETHFLMLVPATVNNEPFNLENLDKLMQHPKPPGHATKYEYFDSNVKEKHGKVAPKTSQWVLMTKDVIPQSRRKSYADQKALVEKVPGRKVPDILSAVTCIITNFVDRKERLFSDEPYTYTRCEEVTAEGYQTVVGALSLSGLDVYNDNYARAYFGVASCLSFGQAVVL